MIVIILSRFFFLLPRKTYLICILTFWRYSRIYCSCVVGLHSENSINLNIWFWNPCVYYTFLLYCLCALSNMYANCKYVLRLLRVFSKYFSFRNVSFDVLDFFLPFLPGTYIYCLFLAFSVNLFFQWAMFML